MLEVGCAHGRMTKYLKEQLNCQIDTIERSMVDNKYSRLHIVGNHKGNIEGKSWKYHLNAYGVHNKIIYDYIIFADVLEHLKNPKKALLSTLKYLNPKGQVWISIPNIAHNAVIIDLLQNKFIYRDVGLLDHTHLKFFTEQSLEKLVDDCGLKIIYKENLINVVNCTEFNNSYEQLPQEVSSYLKNRKNGEVYQFVWGLEKK